MALSKEEKRAIIEGLINNHSTLCPDLFDKNNLLLPHVKSKIDDIVAFIKNGALRSFSEIKIIDISLNGSLCSYVYGSESDIDLFIVVDDIVPNDKWLTEKILNGINSHLFMLTSKPELYGHPVDFGVLHYQNKRVNDFNSYSVLNNCWKKEPVRQEFDFDVDELYQKYKDYSQELHKFVASLNKINDAFLMADSCEKLGQYLQNLRNKAFEAKENSDKHEYSLDYVLYRLLKKFGAYGHFLEYIKVSAKNNMRRGE